MKSIRGRAGETKEVSGVLLGEGGVGGSYTVENVGRVGWVEEAAIMANRSAGSIFFIFSKLDSDP